GTGGSGYRQPRDAVRLAAGVRRGGPEGARVKSFSAVHLLQAVALLLLLGSAGAQAFDLDALNAQLRAQPVLHGDFVQEKHLRALPQPLVSRGQFVLAREHGLLWQLRSPLQQDYRISASGIARRTAEDWQASAGQSANERQNRL